VKTKIHTVYRKRNGEKVPSATTVLSILAKPGLLHWAWECGLEGEDYRKVKDKASDIGTLAHYLIECELKREKPDTSDYSQNAIEKAENSYLAFLEWRDQNKMETIASEIQLVSEKWGYGGTIDWIAKDRLGRNWLIDFKTSKGIYNEFIYQVAAYQMLWEENNPTFPIHKVQILRIDKETGEFETKNISKAELTIGWKIFLHCLEIYKLRRKN